MAHEYPYLAAKGYRYEAIAPFVDFNGKNVVEFNCGRFTRIHELYGEQMFDYVANDIFPAEKTPDWYVCAKDDEFARSLDDKRVDIVLCFGVGGHEITHSPMESATITQTLIDFTRKHRPEILVIESIRTFLPVLERIIKETGYVVRKVLDVKLSDSWLDDRRTYVLERD